MALPTFDEMRPAPGRAVDELETPVLLADLDVLEGNLEAYRELGESHGVAVRSHVKAHKTPAIARRQTAAMGGVLCQKLGEAEVMARHGIDDVLLVCPVVSEPKLERLLWVADRVDRFATVVDGPGNAGPLARAAERAGRTVEVVLEVDAGVERMGVPPGDPAVEAAERIAARPALELRGLLAHDAHVTYAAGDEADYERGCRAVAEALEGTVAGLEAAGIGVEDVVSGSSATARYMARHDVVTELDPGRYVLNDADLLEHRVDIGVEDCGATVLATVISRPTDDRAIVDAGSKTLSYAGSPDPVPLRDGVEFYRKSSEHGYLDVSGADVEVGDRLEFVVPNLYGAINLRDRLVGVRDGVVEEVWHVEARGKDR